MGAGVGMVPKRLLDAEHALGKAFWRTSRETLYEAAKRVVEGTFTGTVETPALAAARIVVDAGERQAAAPAELSPKWDVIERAAKCLEPKVTVLCDGKPIAEGTVTRLLGEGSREVIHGQRFVCGEGTFHLSEAEAAPFREAIARAKRPRTRRTKAEKTAARSVREYGPTWRLKHRLGVHCDARGIRRMRAEHRRWRRDQDRHDVYAIGLDARAEMRFGTVMSPLLRVWERGIFLAVGHGRRGERKARFLAKRGEFADYDDMPF